VLLAPLAAKRGFRLRNESEPNLYAFVDKDQIKQCVLNFVLNAADALEEPLPGGSGLSVDAGRSDATEASAGPDRTEILMSARSAGAVVRVEVRDRGVGMTSEEIVRALEPFYTTKPKGVGLGLPLTRQYIEENEGSLRIESVKGEGTAMVMEFPGRKRPKWKRYSS
jgi:signal transduction histidine kinase